MLGMGYDGPGVSHISKNTRTLRDCKTKIALFTQSEGENVAELNAAPVIDRMQQVVGVRTDIALGQHFGYGTSTVSGWRTRNKVPYEECMILAKRKGVSLDWLLLGVGTMTGSADAHRISADDPTDPRLQRMAGFLSHWTATHGEDQKAWLEMQLARAVPEYAEWVSSRHKA